MRHLVRAAYSEGVVITCHRECESKGAQRSHESAGRVEDPLRPSVAAQEVPDREENLRLGSGARRPRALSAAKQFDEGGHGRRVERRALDILPGPGTPF
jgi:hypothetical protein